MATVSVPARRKLNPRYPGKFACADGTAAVAHVESRISQAVASTGAAYSKGTEDRVDPSASLAQRNVWNEPVELIETATPLTAISAAEGFALAGGRAAVLLSGAGLASTAEALFAIAGKRLPLVMHVAAHSVTSQGQTAYSGHDDVMALADAGWGMLFARNVQEAADLALIARRAAEDSETPFLNVQDAFLTSHTVESLRLPEPELMRVYAEFPGARLRNLFNPHRPLSSGVVQTPESYMNGRIAQRFYYDRVKPSLAAAMVEFKELTGRLYDLIRTYRMDDAEFAFVGLGSMMETAEAAVDHLRRKGVKVGAVSVVSFRPFPAHELTEALVNCRAITVIERTDQPLAQSNPLTMELKAALADAQREARITEVPALYSSVAGLGGREVRPGHFIAAANHMRHGGWRSFVLGVKHTESLAMTEDPDLRAPGSFTLFGYGIGGTGSGAANRMVARISAEVFGAYVQASAQHSPEKRGMPFHYSLLAAPQAVRVHAEAKSADLAVVEDARLLASIECLQALRPEGMLFVRTPLPADEVWLSLPLGVRATVREREIRLYAGDAPQLLSVFLRLAPLRKERIAEALERLAPGEAAEIRRGMEAIQPVEYGPAEQAEEIAPPKPAKWDLPPVLADGRLVSSTFCERIVGSFANRCEHELTADLHSARSLMPASSSRHRSFRNIACDLPAFTAERCTACMECVLTCPDSAITARVTEHATLNAALLQVEQPELRERLSRQFAVVERHHERWLQAGEEGGLFGLFIDADKCKGCGECVQVCDASAMQMRPKAELDLGEFELAMDLCRHLPETPERYVDQESLGGLLLAGRSLLFDGGSGACAGCGENTAVRLVLAATGYFYGSENVGVVGTPGCNAGSGAAYPYANFSVPWTSSLNSNSPADAIGIRVRWNQQGYGARRLWVVASEAAISGPAYQAFSQLLASGLDINVLVLDTRTGEPKELAQAAILYPNVLAAQTTAAHLAHLLKAVKAANLHPGPSVVVAYAGCTREHGTSVDQGAALARLAVESRVFPLFIYDPKAGERTRERLSLAGNPAPDRDWPEGFQPPDGARAHTQRLHNWRRLQEMAGMV